MNIGGQAVIEGVMMRNKEHYAVAIRNKQGLIETITEKSSYLKLFDIIFIRGIINLFLALYDGIRALIWSSNKNLGEEEKMSSREIIGTIFISLLFTIILFIVIPFVSAQYLHSEGLLFNLIDGIIRISLFIIYLLIISQMREVKTLFQYHGAEHKTIACYEAKEPLTIENARKYSRFHPRCGTSFIFIVLLISIILFTFLTGPWYIKIIGRILLLPAIAGISYELIRLSAKFQNNVIIKMIIAPGLWMQRLTTNEPTDQQLEVGIASLKAVLK
ncbi:DUF1385 domain-containing protein [Candidatus Woesearchaeota archaeon]|nr:DUF1385 domain-containing protein [Candidatus Woesearchaeota archaeon]